MTKGRLNWVGHSRNSERIRMFHHRSGNQSFCPVNDLGSQSIYIIRYPTCAGTFRIPGVTNPVESTLGSYERNFCSSNMHLNGSSAGDSIQPTGPSLTLSVVGQRASTQRPTQEKRTAPRTQPLRNPVRLPKPTPHHPARGTSTVQLC